MRALTLFIYVNSTALWRFWSLRTIALRIWVFWWSIEFLEFLFCNCESEFLDAFKNTIISFRAYFCELEAILLYNIFSFLQLYRNYLRAYFTITITFVSEKKDFDVFIAVVMSLRYPEVFDIFERWWFSEVIYHDDSICTFVISWCDGSEPLLSGCIPDLELDGSALMLYGFESW